MITDKIKKIKTAVHNTTITLTVDNITTIPIMNKFSNRDSNVIIAYIRTRQCSGSLHLILILRANQFVHKINTIVITSNSNITQNNDNPCQSLIQPMELGVKKNCKTFELVSEENCPK